MNFIKLNDMSSAQMGLIWIALVILVSQYVMFFAFIMHDEDLVSTKKHFYLWLIPYYMPIMIIYELIKERFDELD